MWSSFYNGQHGTDHVPNARSQHWNQEKTLITESLVLMWFVLKVSYRFPLLVMVNLLWWTKLSASTILPCADYDLVGFLYLRWLTRPMWDAHGFQQTGRRVGWMMTTVVVSVTLGSQMGSWQTLRWQAQFSAWVSRVQRPNTTTLSKQAFQNSLWCTNLTLKEGKTSSTPPRFCPGSSPACYFP